MQFLPRETHEIAARRGLGFAADPGTLLRITDVEGQQPVDVWALLRDDIHEHLSCMHTKPSIQRLFPRIGDAAYTTHRRPVLTLLADTSPGEHDMQFAACDRWRYIELGGPDHADHDNCDDNFHAALASLGHSLPYTPQPWNLFTNFFINPDGSFTVRAPASQPGDHVILRVELPCFVVLSACPQDLNDTCGGRPSPIRLEIGSAA